MGEEHYSTDFREFFRGFRGFPGFSMPMVYRIDLSLQDLFRGKNLPITLNSEQFTLNIEPGMASGVELVVRNLSGGQRDIIFRINELPHPEFTRQNNDLLIEVRINLEEALFGFKRKITHLDGKNLSFRSPPNSTVQPDSVFALAGFGMPVYKMPSRRGTLFVRVKLELPKKLSIDPDVLVSLQRSLHEACNIRSSEGSLQQSSPIDKDCKVLENADLRSFGSIGTFQNGDDADDADDVSDNFERFFFR